MIKVIPNINKGDLIILSGGNKAVVTRVYDEEIKNKLPKGFYGDIQAAYKEVGGRAVVSEVIWNGEQWTFLHNSPSGSHVDLRLYPQLK